MEYLKIGIIKATRGLKGEVKIKSLTNMSSERFKIGNIIYVIKDNKYLPLTIANYRLINNQDILTFKEYEDINKAEKLLGKEKFIPVNQEVELEDNEFLVDDLIGLKVIQTNTVKGIVKDVVTYPQGDYLVVETENGDKMIPFRDEFILDQTEEDITLIEMEGLL